MVSYPSNDSITEGFQKVTKSLKKKLWKSVPFLIMGNASNFPLFPEAKPA